MEFSGNERVNGVTCRGWGLLIKESMVGRVWGGTLRSPFSWCHSLCPRVCLGSSTMRAPLSPLSDVPSRAGTGPHSQTQLKEAQTLPEPDGGVADTLLKEHFSFSASSFCSQAFFPLPRPSDSSPPVCFPPPPPTLPHAWLSGAREFL